MNRAFETAQNFNNLLASILNATEIIKYRLEASSPARRDFEVIHQAVMRARALGCTAGDRPALASGRSTLLLAEDSSTTRTLLRAWLLKEGYGVDAARDGQEAWELFQQDPGRYGLLVTDRIMPRMDGLALCRRIREVSASLPILMTSSSEDPDAFRDALRLHVDEFLFKPFEPRLLVETIGRLCLTRPRPLQHPATACRALEGLPLFSISVPCQDTGGDLFHAFRREDGSVFFALADVTAHAELRVCAGVAFMGLTDQARTAGLELRDLAHRTNRAIQAGPYAQVPIRALFGHWEPGNGRLHLLCAGMPQILWHRAAWGRTSPVAIKGAPLGFRKEPLVEEKVLWLRQGDRLLLGSDGLFDALPTFDGGASIWRSLSGTDPLQALELLAESARARAEGMQDNLLAVALEQPLLYLGQDEFNLSFPSEPKVLDEACDVLGTFLDARGWLGRSERYGTLMAVREALSNAMVHGNAAPEAGTIQLRAQRAKDGGFQVQVLDEGRGFDLEAIRPPDRLATGKDGGLSVIRHFTRSVTMVGGELTMTFS